MATPRLSFITPHSPKSGQDPSGRYMEVDGPSYERILRLQEVSDNVVYQIISSERLRLLGGIVAYREHSSTFSAVLDGTSQGVTVECFHIRKGQPRSSRIQMNSVRLCQKPVPSIHPDKIFSSQGLFKALNAWKARTTQTYSNFWATPSDLSKKLIK